VPRAGVKSEPGRFEETTAFTDINGAFRFEGLKADKYQQNFRKPHYRSDSQSIEIGPSREDVQFRMIPLGVIEGTVADGEGWPLSRVKVEAITISFEGGRRSRATERTATTDDRGAYRLWNLRPGEYYMRVAGKTGGTVSVSRDVASDSR
jgi:protocatechuate 3,4-dioxygenase beta subunit